jgi:hypothetical protein
MKYWTNKELLRLKEICAMPGVFAVHLPDFPGRTVNSLRHRAQKEGWKKKHIYPGRPATAQLKVMKILERRDLCRADIAKALGIAPCTASEILQRLRLSGKVYLKERLDERGATKVWSRSENLAREVLRSSPFGAAAGAVRVPAGATGRVYRHSMDCDDEERVAA